MIFLAGFSSRVQKYANFGAKMDRVFNKIQINAYGKNCEHMNSVKVTPFKICCENNWHFILESKKPSGLNKVKKTLFDERFGFDTQKIKVFDTLIDGSYFKYCVFISSNNDGSEFDGDLPSEIIEMIFYLLEHKKFPKTKDEAASKCLSINLDFVFGLRHLIE